ncbi:YccF domain-containing protein [Streptomyces sp. SID3343]|uniref:YccF domain-containing protein n=1 Tax=Streptomyces sp. SID3343 TaxID=2690260 RepID=UPI00136816A1|nr:YccF domain-containing protein [Streptomyces sp. SID3343]
MKTVLNVIWLVFSGFWLALAYALAGIICFILFFFVVTIPFGIASFRIAGYVLWPFGRTTVMRNDAGIGSLLGNILWIVVCGWWIAIGHLVTGVILCITIIGIPLGLANLKMIPIAFTPLGREIVPTDAPFATR